MSVILYGLLPLLVFVIVDIYAGIRWAIGSAIAFAVLDIFLTKYSLGVWDPGSFVALGLILALGGYSIKTKNPLWFKLQPTVLDGVLLLMLVYIQYFSAPLSVRYGPLVTAQIPDQYRHLFTPEVTATMLDRIAPVAIVILVLHGIINAVAALKLSNLAWLGVRTAGFWALILVGGVVLGILTSSTIVLPQ